MAYINSLKNVPRVGAVVTKVKITDGEFGAWADIEFVDGDAKISPFKTSKVRVKGKMVNIEKADDGRLGYIDSNDRKTVTIHLSSERTKQESASLNKMVNPTEPFEVESHMSGSGFVMKKAKRRLETLTKKDKK